MTNYPGEDSVIQEYKRAMKIIGYLILFLILCYFFFLWLFPFGHFKNAILDSFPESSPVKLRVGEIKPRAPFALVMEKNHIQSDFVKIQFPDIQLAPNLLHLLVGRVGFSAVNSGSIPTLRAKYRQERNLEKIEVWLKKLGVTASFPDGSSVTAEVSGEGIFQWNGQDYANGEGQGWLLIHRGELNQRQISSLPLPLTLFDKMEVEFQVKQGILVAKRIEMTGANQQKIAYQNLQIPLKGGDQISNLGIFFQVPGK